MWCAWQLLECHLKVPGWRRRLWFSRGSTDGQLVVWSSTQNVIRGRLQIMDTGDVRVLSPATVSFRSLFSCFWC